MTSASDAGFGDNTTRSQATCSNGYYPTQHPTDEEYSQYQAGDTYTDYFSFTDEYVTQRYTVKVRSYGATHRFSSGKRALRIRDGGYRKVFTGSGNRDTGNFRAPSANWRASFSYRCDEWTNFIVWAHKPNGDLVELVANELDTSGRGSKRVHGGGKFYLEIETDSGCDWKISIK